MRTPEQIHAGNLATSYVRGWRDGARGTSKRKEFITHQNLELRAAYERGWQIGVDAYSIAAQDAAQIYGHTWSPLRITEGV